MNTIKFITDNWAQIVVVLGALGYIVKVVFDFRLKKFEIKYDLLFKLQTEKIKVFIESYDNYYNALVEDVYKVVGGSMLLISFNSNMDDLNSIMLKNSFECRVYFSDNQSEMFFKISNECRFLKHKVLKIAATSDELETKFDNIEFALDNFQIVIKPVISKILDIVRS